MKKISKVITCLTMMIPFVSSCSSNSKPNNIDDNSKETKGYVTTYPTSVSGALHNRGMGWITLEEQTELGKLDLGKNGDLPEVDNVGIQTSWALIEKTENVFDWSLIDKTIEYWTGKGKRINLRICTDSLSLPEVFFGAPRWLNESPYNVNYQEYSYSGSVMARVNDITDPTYKQYFERFMAKLAERYASNTYIDTIDIRGYGMFGEWHSGHTFKNMEERMFTLAYIVDEYAKYFAMEGKTLFLSNSWDYQGTNDDGSSAATNGICAYEDYLAWSAIDHAMKVEYVGYRRDGMAGNGVTKYSTDEKALSDLIRSGKKVSNCGEFFAGFEAFSKKIYGMDPIEAVDEMMFKSRANYSTVMGWINTEVANIVEKGYAELFNRGNEKMGYRFKVDMAKYPQDIKQGNKAYVLTKISNSGVGRFTLPNHNLRLYLIDSNGVIKQAVDNKNYDLRILLNGETMNVYTSFNIDKNLSDGEYTLAVSIVDETGAPAIRLAQVGNYKQKMYPLGKMNVGNYKQIDKFYEEVNGEDLKNIRLKASSNYEVTFEYTPSLKLSEHKMGDEDGFIVVTKDNKKEENVVSNFQDVSEEKAIKTVSVITGNNGPYSLEIYGKGIYANKIKTGKIIIENKTGYVQSFDKKYNLLSSKNAWYSDNENVINNDTNILGSKGSIEVLGEVPHQENDGLVSDPSLLKIKNNAAYTITFSTKGASIAGNASYYYLHLMNNDASIQTIGEWYDRPDEPNSIKSFTFITPKDGKLSLAFGVKNIGSYLIDNINIVENPKGLIVTGDDVKNINNVRPFDSNKGLDYVEGFEGMVLNDSTFTYGFNRWGHLTNDKTEVISGKYSMSSRLDEETYRYFNDNWFEFMYSNSKYIKLEANTSYRVEFSYKLMEKIKQNTNPLLDGYAYILARSQSYLDKDTAVGRFADNVELNRTKKMIYDFTTGAANDYYIVIGLYGKGVLIVDDIKISKK